MVAFVVIVVPVGIFDIVGANDVDLTVAGMFVDLSPFSLVVADAELVDDVANELVELTTRPANRKRL